MSAATEAVLDTTETALDEFEEVVEVVRNNPKALFVVGFAGLSIGVVGGYFAAKRTLKSFYEDLAQREIAEAKAFYAGVFKVDEDGELRSPQDVMAERHGTEAAAEALRVYRGVDHQPENAGAVTPEEIEEDEKLLAATEAALLERRRLKREADEAAAKVEINVFVDDTFDLEEELKHRSPTAPYIITHDEFFAGELEYDTNKLTYFEKDEVLTDERDKPVADVDTVVGEEHLNRFGSGSKDPNVVYIRNEMLEIDYEIVRSKGSYLKEVLDMDEESKSLKHSDNTARRREFRHGDG